MKNKNSLFILSGLLVILVIGLVLIFHKDNAKENENNYSSNVPGISYSLEESKKMLYNNFLISYILEGDVSVGDATLTYDGVIYNAVNDERLNDIKSFEDISNLIDNNLFPDIAVATRKRLENGNYNRYRSVGNILYVKKASKVCNKTKKINLEDVTYKINEDGKRIVIFYDDDYIEVFFSDLAEKWLVGDLNFTCSAITYAELSGN